MDAKLIELQAMLNGVIAGYPEGSQRMRALQSVQWRLVSTCGRYAGLSAKHGCVLASADKAVVYTGLDNEVMKLAFWQSALKCELAVEILGQVTKHQTKV